MILFLGGVYGFRLLKCKFNVMPPYSRYKYLYRIFIYNQSSINHLIVWTRHRTSDLVSFTYHPFFSVLFSFTPVKDEGKSCKFMKILFTHRKFVFLSIRFILNYDEYITGSSLLLLLCLARLSLFSVN